VASSNLFDVQVRLEGEEPPPDVGRLVTGALEEASPLGGVKGAVGVTASERGVVVRFEDVAVPEDGHEGQFGLQDVLPVVQALINAIVERMSSGPPTNPRLIIEVQPATPHEQQELRHS
jgi:hypothetical protein